MSNSFSNPTAFGRKDSSIDRMHFSWNRRQINRSDQHRQRQRQRSREISSFSSSSSGIISNKTKAKGKKRERMISGDFVQKNCEKADGNDRDRRIEMAKFCSKSYLTFCFRWLNADDSFDIDACEEILTTQLEFDGYALCFFVTLLSRTARWILRVMTDIRQVRKDVLVCAMEWDEPKTMRSSWLSEREFLHCRVIDDQNERVRNFGCRNAVRWWSHRTSRRGSNGQYGAEEEERWRKKHFKFNEETWQWKNKMIEWRMNEWIGSQRQRGARGILNGFSHLASVHIGHWASLLTSSVSLDQQRKRRRIVILPFLRSRSSMGILSDTEKSFLRFHPLIDNGGLNRRRKFRCTRTCLWVDEQRFFPLFDSIWEHNSSDWGKSRWQIEMFEERGISFVLRQHCRLSNDQFAQPTIRMFKLLERGEFASLASITFHMVSTTEREKDTERTTTSSSNRRWCLSVAMFVRHSSSTSTGTKENIGKGRKRLEMAMSFSLASPCPFTDPKTKSLLQTVKRWVDRQNNNRHYFSSAPIINNRLSWRNRSVPRQSFSVPFVSSFVSRAAKCHSFGRCHIFEGDLLMVGHVGHARSIPLTMETFLSRVWLSVHIDRIRMMRRCLSQQQCGFSWSFSPPSLSNIQSKRSSFLYVEQYLFKMVSRSVVSSAQVRIH